MKKLGILLLGAMAVVAAACEDSPSVPPIQANPQGPVYEVDGVTVEEPSETAIVLKDYADAGMTIPVANFLVSDFPEGFEMKVVTYISKDQSTANLRLVNSTLSENTVYVTADDFQDAYVAGISKSPAAKNVYIRFAIYAVGNGQELRLGSEDTYLGGYTMNITPFPSDIVVENNYYLVGTVNGWDVPTALKMNHSDESPYDDPIFTIQVNITQDQAAEGWWWKILPESTVAAGTWVDQAYSSYGPEENGSADLSGMLFASTMENGQYHDSQAGCVDMAGSYMLTVNMVEGTYDFQLTVEQLYVMGAAANWDWSSPLVAVLTTNNYSDYYGYASIAEGGYKFTSEKDWSANFNLGMNSDPEIDANHNISGTLVNNAGNINPAVGGLYWNHVNLQSFAFTSYYVSTYGIIGDATPGGWNESTALTPSEDYLVWTAKVLLGDGEFKFRANDDWAVNLGGELGNLTQDGANLTSPGAGLYTITLDLSTVPYTATLTK